MLTGKFSSKESDFVKSNYQSLSIEEMAKELNRPNQSVRMFVISHKLYREEDKNHVKFFDIECHPEYAYLLGWVFSDGHVSKVGTRLSLSIMKNDADIIKTSMMKIYPWKIRQVNFKDNRVAQTEFACYRKDAYNFFIDEWGFDRKSYGMPNSFFNYISNSSDDCRRCFLRGLFDGDGYVFKPKPFLSIGKRIDFDWTNILKLIPGHFRYTIRIKDPGTGRCRGSSLEIYRDGPLFFQYIYNSSFKLALPRKKDRVLAHFEKPYYRDKYGPLINE